MAPVNATFPPKWVKLLPAVCQQLQEQVMKAQDQGAFKFASTFSDTRHPLYIQPSGLFKRVKDELLGKGELLREAAQTGQPRGVLIWGSKGMGKTSLAKDVACEFNSDPGASQLPSRHICDQVNLKLVHFS
jgi:predicted AAA+ superfamily ATPase